MSTTKQRQTHRLRTLDDAVNAALEQYHAARGDPDQEHIWRRVLAGLDVGIGAVLEKKEARRER
jgi:hypothetical protein